VNRNAAFGVGALLGAAAALVWDRRKRLGAAPAAPVPETRQRELREKLAGAQQPEAAHPAPEPRVPPPESPPAPATPPPQSEAKPPPPPPAPGPPPADEFEAMRRRIHEEGKAAAEDMRRAPDEDS
jgi:hypothetical protein